MAREERGPARGERGPAREERGPGLGGRGLVPRDGELISAVSALVLLVLMFAVKWFGVILTPGRHGARSGTPSAENAWNGLVLVRWVMLLTIVVALGSVVIHGTQRSHGARTDTSVAVTLLGGLTTALLIYRVLIDLPSPSAVVDQKLGAILGVVAAAGVTLGGYESLRERRALQRHLAGPRESRPRCLLTAARDRLARRG